MLKKIRTKVVCILLASIGIPLLMAANCLPQQPLINSIIESSALQVDDQVVEKVSQGRINAARALKSSSAVYVDILEHNNLNIAQLRCWPLGNGGAIAPWDSRFGGPITLSLSALSPPIPASEYDRLITIGQTDFVMSIRVAHEPTYPLQFSSVEFNFRAVNPDGQAVPGPHYNVGEADLPSNDPTIVNRSVFEMRHSDIAIVVRGLQFDDGATPITNTRAFMNNLGSTAWMLFMRDNALISGRYYALLGAWTGGPVAFLDTPSPADDGFFQSVQVNGDVFDIMSEPPGNMDPTVPRMCTFTPTMPYAFLDISNVDETGAPAGGRGGFILVIRREAFQDGPVDPVGVVVDPSHNPLNPPVPTNIMDAPPSGYDGAADGPDGVHELSVSVFFIHT